MRRLVITLAAFGIMCSSAALGEDKDAASSQFAEGKAQLAKGAFDQALAAFKAASKADPTNDEYFGEYAMLKRVVNIRKAIAEEQDADAWRQMARGLYAYYRQYKLHDAALEIATAMQAKMNNAESAVALADVQLAAGKNAEAVELLAKIPADQATPHAQAIQGLALARTGKLDEAKTLAAKLALPKDCTKDESCDADVCWDAARLFAAIGEGEKALATLKCLFECTPAPQAAAVKAEARTAPEFARLVASTEFAQVLETKSKAAASCGSGKSCAGCPSAKADGCSSAAKDAKPADKASGCAHDKADPKAGEKKAGGCTHEQEAAGKK